MTISEINADLPLIMCYLDALGFSSENKDIMNTLFSWDEEAFIPLQGYQEWMHPRYCNKTKSLGKLVNNKKDFVFTHSFTNKNYARGFTSLNVPDLKVPSFEASILFMLVSHGQVFINNGDVTSCFVDSRDRGYGQIYLPYAKEVIDLIEAKKPNISQNAESKKYAVTFNDGLTIEKESLFEAAILSFLSTKLRQVEVPTYLRYCYGLFSLDGHTLKLKEN